MTTAKARQHVAATRRLCRGSEASCALEQPCASEPVPSCAMVRSGQVRHAGGKPFTVDLVGQAERLRGLPQALFWGVTVCKWSNFAHELRHHEATWRNGGAAVLPFLRRRVPGCGAAARAARARRYASQTTFRSVLFSQSSAAAWGEL